jgi:hypothetical protein
MAYEMAPIMLHNWWVNLNRCPCRRRALVNFELCLGVYMGQLGRENSDALKSDESGQATAREKNTDLKASQGSSRQGGPDSRRRALILGLATTPVLLSLMNRSALAQEINCSALASVVLGGSAANLPAGLGGGEGGENNNVPDHAIQNMYDAQCKDEGQGGNTNVSTSANARGNSNRP